MRVTVSNNDDNHNDNDTNNDNNGQYGNVYIYTYACIWYHVDIIIYEINRHQKQAFNDIRPKRSNYCGWKKSCTRDYRYL